MEEKTDQEKSIDARLDEEVDYWKPEEGSKLIGKYVGFRTGIGQYNTNLHLIQIERDEGLTEIIGVWGSKIIDEKLKDVKEGTAVGIKFLGIQKGKAGNYKNYRVIVEENPETIEQKEQFDADIP